MNQEKKTSEMSKVSQGQPLDDTSSIGAKEPCGSTSAKDGVMNIGLAKEYFEKGGHSVIDELDNLVKVWRRYGVDDPWPNNTYTHALGLTGVMLRHTDFSFRMLTGGAGDGFISSLSTYFASMLKRLKKKGGKAQIIVVDGDVDSDCLQKLRAEFPDVLSTKKGTSSGKQVAHYIVCDTDMIRDEKPHGPLNNNTPESEIKADVYFNNSSMAALFSERFDTLWDRLKSQDNS